MENQEWSKVDVENLWTGKEAFVVGGGPSLLPHLSILNSYSRTSGQKFVAANDSYKLCRCDAVVSSDFTWLEKRSEEFNSIHAPVFGILSQDRPRPIVENLSYIKAIDRGAFPTLSTDPEFITNGLNSGFIALNYAFLKKPKRIFLLGLDFRPAADRSHCHAGYGWHSKENALRLYPKWAQIVDSVYDQVRAAGIEIFNCSDSGVLKAYPHFPYEKALA